MANFDQRGQKVIYQFNSNGDINFGTVQNKSELADELKKLLPELSKAIQTGAIQDETGVDVESHIKKAIIQVEKSSPDKKSILQNIENAKKLIEGIASASGLVSALIQAAELARKFFL